MADHNEFGEFGEQYATDYLINNGYVILERNYRYLKAEIDIIAQKGSTLVVVEVKSRTSSFMAEIVELITPKKIKLLVSAADHFIIEKDLDLEVRFDIVTIIKSKTGFKLDHLENAFYHF